MDYGGAAKLVAAARANRIERFVMVSSIAADPAIAGEETRRPGGSAPTTPSSRAAQRVVGVGDTYYDWAPNTGSWELAFNPPTLSHLAETSRAG